MNNKVRFFECYDFNEKVMLMEMVVDDSSEKFDLFDFFVPGKYLSEDNNQCAYMEQYLNSDGTEKICQTYGIPDFPVKPYRVAFFIFKYGEQEKKLVTPYGEFSLENLKPVPRRLKECIEFEDVYYGDEDDD